MGCVSWNKNLKGEKYKEHFKNGMGGLFGIKENNPHWKNGIYVNNPKKYKHNWYLKNKERLIPLYKKYYLKNREKTKDQRKIYKKKWVKNNPIKMKAQYARRRFLSKDLNVKTVQRVYEDNIKKYGTLTCYLCKKPIMFGKDHLEHKIPLSRGGTNDYKNLAVACQHCNCSKHNRTELEYIKIQKGRS